MLMKLDQLYVILANKIFIEQNSPEPKDKVFIPVYEPLEVTKCKKRNKIVVEPRELIRIQER